MWRCAGWFDFIGGYAFGVKLTLFGFTCCVLLIPWYQYMLCGTTALVAVQTVLYYMFVASKGCVEVIPLFLFKLFCNPWVHAVLN